MCLSLLILFLCPNYNLLIHWCKEWGDKPVDICLPEIMPEINVRDLGQHKIYNMVYFIRENVPLLYYGNVMKVFHLQ